MYHNLFFVTDSKSDLPVFSPRVISAYKILTDESYYHICDAEEKSRYDDDTFCFIRCIIGFGVIYLKDKSIKLSANDYVVLRFHDIVKYHSTSNVFAYRWVNFRLYSPYDLHLGEIKRINVTEAEERLFDSFMSIGMNIVNSRYINSLFCSYYFSVLFGVDIKKISCNKTHSTEQTEDICTYIEQKVFNKITVSEIAAFFNISQRRLHQIFVKKVGVPPKKYIIKKKMDEGYRLLVQTSIPINKIAESLCFNSQYHFTNEFKKIFHRTPTEVRNMERIKTAKHEKSDRLSQIKRPQE